MKPAYAGFVVLKELTQAAEWIKLATCRQEMETEMENYIDQMIAHRETLVFQVKTLESDLTFADGLMYSGITLKISRIQQEIKAVNDEIHRYTFVGPEFPEWIRSQRNCEQVDIARKTRIQSAIEKIEQLFGGAK